MLPKTEIYPKFEILKLFYSMGVSLVMAVQGRERFLLFLMKSDDVLLLSVRGGNRHY